MSERRRPGRPKGSGRGLIVASCRLEPETYQALEEWRLDQLDENQEPMPQAEAMRRLVRWALEQRGGLAKLSPLDAGYQQGLRNGRADFHKALDRAWAEVTKS